MKVKTVKQCRDCGDDFKPFKTTDTRCVDCIIKKVQKDNQRKRDKEIKKIMKPILKKKREGNEALKKYSKWLAELQTIFNKFIRTRDKNRVCISCQKPLITNPRAWKAQYDAGHFYNVNGYPNLRFNEDNVHGQCVRCNRDLHSNNTEYAIHLPERIGVDRFIELQSIRHNKPLKLLIPEIKELKTHYRQLIKNLEA